MQKELKAKLRQVATTKKKTKIKNSVSAGLVLGQIDQEVRRDLLSKQLVKKNSLSKGKKGKRDLIKELDRPVPEDDNNCYLAHIEELSSILEINLNRFSDLDVNLQLVAVKTVNEKVEKLIKNGKFSPEDGRIWPNQIETFVEVVESILREPWRSIVLIGSTQLGKTMSVILCFVLESVLYAKTKVKYKAIYLTPDSISLERQTKEDYSSFLSLYDFLVETNESEPFRFSEYQRRTHALLHHGESNDSPIHRRSGGRIKDEIKKLMEKYHKDGVRIILIVDECHWGSDAKGILNQIISFAQDLTKKAQETKKDGDIMIAISATPFNFGNLGILKRIFCRTYDGYIGYAFWNGQLLDSRHTLRLPEHISFESSKISDRFGVDDFMFVNRKYYINKHEYEKARSKKDKQGFLTLFGFNFEDVSHDEYKEFCEEKLIALVNSCLTDHNELNARGFIVRFFFKNDDVADFLNRKRHQFDSRIKVVDWKGNDARNSLADHLRTNEISEDDLKAVFVTGSGRMGNRIEDSDRIYYGADFAPASNLTAVLQGLLGRMTGSKSVAPIMFMERKPCEDLDEYIVSLGKRFRRKPYSRTNRNGFSIHGESITLWLEENNVSGKIMFDAENIKFLNEYTKEVLKNKKDLKGHRISDVHKKRFWDRFNHETFNRIEEMLHANQDIFIRYSEEERNDKPYVDKVGYSYDGVVAFRSALSDSASNSNLPTDRLANGMKNGKRRLAPSIVVKRVQNGRSWIWKPICVKFRLLDVVSAGVHKLLPNHKDTAYHHFSSSQEQSLADEGY